MAAGCWLQVRLFDNTVMHYEGIMVQQPTGLTHLPRAVSRCVVRARCVRVPVPAAPAAARDGAAGAGPSYCHLHKKQLLQCRRGRQI